MKPGSDSRKNPQRRVKVGLKKSGGPKKLMVDQLITGFSMVFPWFFPLFSHVFPLVSRCSPKCLEIWGATPFQTQQFLQDADPNAGGQPTSGGLGERVETLEGVRPSRRLAVQKGRKVGDRVVPEWWYSTGWYKGWISRAMA